MSYLINQYNFQQTYTDLVGHNIRVDAFDNSSNSTVVVRGKCVSLPEPIIIFDGKRDIHPSMQIQQYVKLYIDSGTQLLIQYVPFNKISKIYKICTDSHSRLYAGIVCRRKRICNDIVRYIAQYMQGWTYEVCIR